MTLYDIKPQFQSLLRPLVKQLAKAGVTANQVTLAAAAGSLILGGILGYSVITGRFGQGIFLLLPLWMFIRMALNAIDGMLAREFGQQSHLGAYLNELCDVVSDVALFLPFAFVSPFTPASVIMVIFLALLSEFAGVLGLSVGASRRYDGPVGKSDRALVFGALGLWLGLGLAGILPQGLFWIMPVLSVLLVLTTIKRIKNGLAEAAN